MLKEDYEYTLKKFGLTNDEFDAIMQRPLKTFESYPNLFETFEKLKKIRAVLKK